MKRTIVIFLIVFSIPCCAQWKNTGFSGYGAQVLVFGVHDTSLFLRAPDNGSGAVLLRTALTDSGISPWVETDNGIDWTQGNVTSFASLGTYFFAGMMRNGGPGAGWESTDNGSHWTNNGGGFMYSNGTYIFGSGTSSLYRSRDNGNTFQAVDCPDASALGSIGAYIFASTPNGVYRSTDTGNNWSELSAPFSGAITVMGSLLFMTDSERVVMSSDSGLQWKAVPVDSGSVQENVNVLATDGKHLFAGTGGGVFISTDSGATWQAENDGLTYGWENVIAMAVFDTLLFANMPAPTGNFYTAMRPISEMTKDTTSGVVEIQPADSLSIFPNPAMGTVTILAGGTSIEQIEMLNVLGEEVLSVPASHESEISLDISELPSGTYFMQIQTANGIILRKIVKEE